MKEIQKIIISASRRTDVPKFYYKWFQDALLAGKVEIQNPRYPSKSYHVDLRPENVHSIVLWSKDFGNVLKEPMLLENYNLYFQYTINNYSKRMEPGVPDYEYSLKVLEGLLKKHGPKQFNIRFDPVIISKYGEVENDISKPGIPRLKAFERLCMDLVSLGMVNCRVTTSYICMYKHIVKPIENSGIDIIDLNEDKQLLLFEKMVEIASRYSINLYSCAAPLIEKVEGINKGHCIDGQLLQYLFGGKVTRAKDTGQREACGCTRSRDIGAYKPCGHGCVYCYQ